MGRCKRIDHRDMPPHSKEVVWWYRETGWSLPKDRTRLYKDSAGRPMW
jgi:hypothetical protein